MRHERARGSFVESSVTEPRPRTGSGYDGETTPSPRSPRDDDDGGCDRSRGARPSAASCRRPAPRARLSRQEAGLVHDDREPERSGASQRLPPGFCPAITRSVPRPTCESSPRRDRPCARGASPARTGNAIRRRPRVVPPPHRSGRGLRRRQQPSKSGGPSRSPRRGFPVRDEPDELGASRLRPTARGSPPKSLARDARARARPGRTGRRRSGRVRPSPAGRASPAPLPG